MTPFVGDRFADRRPRLFAFLWYALLAVALFAVSLFLYREPVASCAYPGGFDSDLQTYFGPLSIPWMRAIWAGEFPPHWIDSLFLGMPYLANAQVQAFYPLKALLLPFAAGSLGCGFAFIAALHITLAGVGAAALARSFDISRCAALLTATSFALGGWLLNQSEDPTILYSAAWMPWVVWAAMRARRTRRSMAWGMLASLFVAFQLVAGGFQVAFATSLGTLLMLVGLDFFPTGRRSRLSLKRRIAGTTSWIAVVAVFGVALAAVQVFTALDLAEWTARGSAEPILFDDLGARRGTDWLLLLSPFALGDSSAYSSGASFRALAVYLGLVPIALIVLGGLTRLFDRTAMALLVVAAVFAWLSTGSGARLYDGLAAVIPTLVFAGYTAHFFVFGALLLAVAAAQSADALVDKGIESGWPVVVTSVLLVVAAIVLGVVGTPFRALAVFAVAAALTVTVLSIPAINPARKRFVLPSLLAILACELLVQWVDASDVEARVDTGVFQEGQDVVDAFGDGPLEPRILYQALGSDSIGALANAGTLHGYQNLTGYDAQYPQRLESFASLLGSDGGARSRHTIEFARPLHPLVRKTGVQFLVVPPSELDRALAAQTAGESPFASVTSGRRGTVLELADPAPRASLAPAWEPVSTAAEALVALGNDPDGYVVETPLFGPASCVAEGTVEVDVWTSDYREFSVESSCATMLFVMTSYHDGWWAIVNEVMFPVLPGNHAFLAIPIPDGESDVILRYDQTGWVNGVRFSLSALGLVVLVLLGRMWHWLRTLIFPPSEE